MPTERQYRRAFWARLDDGVAHLVASATSTTCVITRLINATSNASTNQFRGRWILHATGSQAGQQRRIRRQGYTPSTGTLTIYPDWTAPTANDEVEITSLFPGLPDIEADTSYQQMLNSGLRVLCAPRDQGITLTTVADQRDYSLSAYAHWLDDPRRVVAVYDPPRGTSEPVKPTWRQWEIVWVSGTPTLRFHDRGYPRNGFTVRVEVDRPAYTLISGAESTTGFSGFLGTETATVSIPHLNEAALYFAYEALASRAKGEPDGVNWDAKAEDQSNIVRALPSYDRIGAPLGPPLQSSQEAA